MTKEERTAELLRKKFGKNEVRVVRTNNNKGQDITFDGDDPIPLLMKVRGIHDQKIIGTVNPETLANLARGVWTTVQEEEEKFFIYAQEECGYSSDPSSGYVSQGGGVGAYGRFYNRGDGAGWRKKWAHDPHGPRKEEEWWTLFDYTAFY